MSGVLRRNLIILYSAELLGKILGLVVFGYLSRTLLDARFGDLQFALGLLMMLSLVIDAGLANYGAREAAKAPEETDRLVGQIFLVRSVLVVIAVLLLLGVVAVLPRDPIARAVILLQAMVLIPMPMVLTWVFQARDQMGVVAASSVIRQLFLAVGVFVFVRSPSDVWVVPLADASGLAVGVILQLVLFRRAGGRIRPHAYVSGTRVVVVEAAPLAASSVVWAVRLFSPLLALGVFTTSAQTGIFGAGHQLVIAAHTFVWLYFFNLLPSLSRLAMDEGLVGFRELFSTSMRLVGWVGICGASVGAALAPFLIPTIFGADFATAGPPFAVMMWMLAIAFVSGHHRFGLIALSLQREEFWASAAGAVVAVGGCVLIGPELTPTSAAWIFVTAEFTTLIAASFFLKRATPSLAVTEGVRLPLGVTLVAVLGVGLLGVEGPFRAAGLLIALYAVAVGLFDRDILRQARAIVAIRRSGD